MPLEKKSSDNLPHICFLAPNAYPILAGDSGVKFAGGAELQQVILARELANRGYRVSMICLDVGQDKRVEVDGIVVYRAFRQEAGLPIVRFISPRLSSIWRCMNAANADIYYHRAASMLTGAMAAFCRWKGKKSIFAVAGEPKIRFARDRWLYMYGLKHVDCIAVQTINQLEDIRGTVNRESVLIPNLYQGNVQEANNTSNVVLWVGTIRQVKRPDIMLDLAAALPDLRFRMIGGQSGADRQFFDSIDQRAKAIDNLEFVGFVPYDEIGRYFDDATLFVNTSDSEGFPNTFLQSWARSVPTVSFIDSGAKNEGQEIGCVVDSVESMADKVSYLMANDREREEIGRQSASYVREHHHLDRILEIYETQFAKLVS